MLNYFSNDEQKNARQTSSQFLLFVNCNVKGAVSATPLFLFTSGNDKLNNGSKFKSETVIVEKTHAGDTVCLNNVIIIEREGGGEREGERGRGGRGGGGGGGRGRGRGGGGGGGGGREGEKI